MKKVFLLSVFISLVSILSFGQSKDEKQLTDAITTLKNAMLNADRQQLEMIASPALSYGHSSGKMEDKAAFVDALATGKSDFITMDLSDQTITVLGKTAIVRHNLTGRTKDNGVEGTANIGVLQVWQKEKGKWKLLARQAYKR